MGLTINPIASSGTKISDTIRNNFDSIPEVRINGNIRCDRIDADVLFSSYLSTANIENVDEAIRNLQERLLIVERDLVMEEKYPELKRAGTRYVEIKNKYETLEIIKGEK